MASQRYFRIVAAVAALLGGTLSARGAILIDNSTPGFYNAGIGNLLNGTDPIFTGDPTLSVSTAPDISAAATQLGGWLSIPPNLTIAGATWSATPIPIPALWEEGTETAVVYSIDSAGSELDNVRISMGVDNGILIWLDGAFVHGDAAPGGPDPLGEYIYELGNLASGVHYLHFIRVGQSAQESWNIQVTSGIVAEPSSVTLVAMGFVGVKRLRRRNMLRGVHHT
jgi:hypothetical protein